MDEHHQRDSPGKRDGVDRTVTFVRHCAEIAEREGELDWPQPNWEASRSYAIGAIVMAVSALEASINELYLEAVD